jgi:hypothetical protein
MRTLADNTSGPFLYPDQPWLMGYLGAVATLLMNGTPVLLGALAIDRHLSLSHLGLFGSAGFLGQLVAVGSAFFWIHRVNWRTLSQICALGSLAACLLMAFASTPPLLVISSLALGALMGCCYATVLSYWGTARNPARAISIGILMQVLIASGFLYVVPAILTPRWGVRGGALLLAVSILPIFPLSFVIPRKAIAPPRMSHSYPKPRQQAPALAGLTIMALYYVGLFALWAFLDRIGAASGLDQTAIGVALSVSMLIGAFALVCTTIIGERLGLLPPLAASLFLYGAFFLLLLRPQTIWLFTLVLIIFNFAWNVALPYQIAIIARADSTGRLIILLPAFQAAGASCGPMLAGHIVGDGHFNALYVLLGICVAIASVGFGALAISFPRGAL